MPGASPQSKELTTIKKNPNWLRLFLILEIIIVVIGVSTGGYLYLTKDKSEALVTNITTTEKVDTSDWKTHENYKLGGSFQHPLGWVTEPISSVTTLYNQDLYSEEAAKKPTYSEKTLFPEDFIILQFAPILNSDVSQVSEYSTAKDWLNDLNQKKEKAFKVFGYDVNSAKNITINQKPVVVLKGPLYNTDAATVFIQEEGNVFLITIAPYDKIEDKIVLQIISTFKVLLSK